MQPYIEPQLSFQLDVYLRRIVHAQVTANMGKIRIGLFYQLLFSWADGQVCNGLGYGLGDINLNITYGYLVYTCYTGVAKDLFDWNAVWNGEWNENKGECALLSDWARSTVSAISVLSATEAVFLGTDSVNGAGCVIFANLGTAFTAWAPYYSTLAYKLLRHLDESDGL